METLNIAKGFKNRLAGKPDSGMMMACFPKTIAVSARGIPHIRPKLLVREGDRVQTGSPVFTDKRDTGIQYVSPGTGTVKQVLYGERRRLLEVIVELDKQDDFIEFDSLSASAISRLSKQELMNRLKQGGVWQGLRQLPFRDMVNPSESVPMIIVCMNGNDVFSPQPGVVLQGRMEEFKLGLEVLNKFSDRILVTAAQGSLAGLGGAGKYVTHVLPDVYPAWDPAVVLYHIKTGPEENSAWYIGLDHLIMVGQFLKTGRYPIDKVMSVTRSKRNHPHILCRQGSPVNILDAGANAKYTITTGRFNGCRLSPDSHMGFFDNTLNIIDGRDREDMFGFLTPGFSTPTVSKTYFSSLWNPPREMDGTLHGEERACISCSYCENICPNDLMPQFITKALLADDIDEALALGVLDCCRCGLCTFTCPSKIELANIISDGIDVYYKDKS